MLSTYWAEDMMNDKYDYDLNNINPNTSQGMWGRCKKKKLSPKEKGGGSREKKHAQSWARTQNLPRPRQESPAAHLGHCLDK